MQAVEATPPLGGHKGALRRSVCLNVQLVPAVPWAARIAQPSGGTDLNTSRLMLAAICAAGRLHKQ